MTTLRRNGLAAGATAAVCGFLAVIEPALAHHMMDGTLPTNAVQGLLSGLAHPVIGLDHLAFVLAVGLLATMKPNGGYTVPAVFIAMTLLGTGTHVAHMDIPLAEAGVAISLIVAGVMLFAPAGTSVSAMTLLAGVAGLFHGYAYGESVVGSEATPLVSYLIGFSLIQFLLAMGAYAGAKAYARNRPAQIASVWRVMGGIVSMLGLGFLATAAVM